MRSRGQRLMTIRNILGQDRITTQEDLMNRLKTEGFIMTQATLSRDLKYLGAGKMPDNEKGYIYKISGEGQTDQTGQVPVNFPVNGYLSLEFANHLGVMKVLPGFASSIASSIDQINSREILGTVAGDDTILIVPREGISYEAVWNVLAGVIPKLK
jgi:transcriptional regulator of arginine metabolism